MADSFIVYPSVWNWRPIVWLVWLNVHCLIVKLQLRLLTPIAIFCSIFPGYFCNLNAGEWVTVWVVWWERGPLVARFRAWL